MKQLFLITVTILSSYMAYSQPSTASERDKNFVACMARKSLMEIKLSELAETNGLAVEVKDMGKHIIEDHTKTNGDLKVLADKKGILFPTTLNTKQQKAYDKMSTLKGDTFDKHYLKCMGKDHKKSKRELKKEIKKGDDVDLEAWAQISLPMVQHHQDMVKAACKSVRKK
jgi:putative membrane protein